MSEKTLKELKEKIDLIDKKIDLIMVKLEIKKPKPFKHITEPKVHTF